MNSQEIRDCIRAAGRRGGRISQAHLEKTLLQLFKNFVHFPFIMAPPNETSTAWRFHRAIKYDQRPDNICMLSYPPVLKAVLGRANLAGHPVFYCSGDPRSTLFELAVTIGDTIVLSKWVLTSELLISPIGYSKDIFTRLNSYRDCPAMYPKQIYNRNASKLGNKLIAKFLSEEFTNSTDKPDYQLTALISKQFLVLQPECAIAYPTIAMRANAENFALTTDAVDKKLQIKEVHWLEITSVGDFEYTFKPLSFANSFTSDGQINWVVPNDEHKCSLKNSILR